MESLKDIRENAGLTVAELASQAGVSITVVYRMENGKIAVSRVYAQKVLLTLSRITEKPLTLADFPSVQIIEEKNR